MHAVENDLRGLGCGRRCGVPKHLSLHDESLANLFAGRGREIKSSTYEILSYLFEILFRHFLRIGSQHATRINHDRRADVAGHHD